MHSSRNSICRGHDVVPLLVFPDAKDSTCQVTQQHIGGLPVSRQYSGLGYFLVGSVVIAPEAIPANQYPSIDHDGHTKPHSDAEHRRFLAAPTIPTMPILVQNKKGAVLTGITDIDIGGASLLTATSFSYSKTCFLRDANSYFSFALQGS